MYNLQHQLLSKVEELEGSGRHVRQSTCFQHGKLYSKNLKIMANFIVERL